MKALLRAAFVIARRDFTALIFSKSFILFLIVPIFPLAIGVAGGWVGNQIASEGAPPFVGLALAPTEAGAVIAARDKLARQIGDGTLPAVRVADRNAQAGTILSGTLRAPILSGEAGEVARMKGDVALIVSVARAGAAMPVTTLATRITGRTPGRTPGRIAGQSEGSLQQARLATGRGAQTLLFLLTVVLAGMVLSNMVEEKTNKIIEILAAAVPIDAIFLGKLMAMLGMSFIGITVWGSSALLVQALMPPDTLPLATPAVGWPLFILLGFVYFATAYTLLGSLFIGIGAQANTVREVQTLSMPVTMCQVPIFLFTTYASSHGGQWPELGAAIFPFSSPFAMVARAAQSGAIWPHLLAIGWQLLWVAIIIRIGVRLFRRNVLKSAQPARRRGLFSRKRASDARDGA